MRTKQTFQDPTLIPFFDPSGVVVVGASREPTKLGYGLARNLIQGNYAGAVHLVNPNGGQLFGRPLYTDVRLVPDPVELAVLLIPAAAVPAALHACGERGLKAAIIASGGFRESGPDGARLEAECLRIARSYGIRLIGPNSIGLLDTHLPIDATFLSPPGPLPGEVAFISHSGAICAAVIDWARGHSFGLSRLVSLGNQADINESDLLDPVAADPFTHVLTLYLEGLSDGRRFVREAQKISPHKPIIALKVGRFASGQRAVSSHTGALAGQEIAFNAAFRRAGVIRADTSEEMFDWARALAWCPPPAGRGVAILTNAGGPGVTAADAIEANGLYLAPLHETTRQALAAVLPSAASLQNPVDMLASASPEQYACCLQILLDDPAVSSVLVILPPPPMSTAGAVARAMIPVIHHAGKPVVIALMGERLIQEAVEHLRAARVPEYRFPERAASALAILAERAAYLQRLTQTGGKPSEAASTGIDVLAARLEVQAFCASAAPGEMLPQGLLHRLLSIYQIPTPPMSLAQSPAEAAALAAQMGFPVVLKIASSQITHKSDVGGIFLNLHTADEVQQAYLEAIENARRSFPEAEILGVYLQPMLPAGQDVILGALQDAHFGALVMFGSGGVEVEAHQDVAFALAPLTDDEAEYLLENTWAGRKLRGFRNLPPADREAVKGALHRLSMLASDLPELAEIEINPLRVLPHGGHLGGGIFALDVRARYMPTIIR